MPQRRRRNGGGVVVEDEDVDPGMQRDGNFQCVQVLKSSAICSVAEAAHKKTVKYNALEVTFRDDCELSQMQARA